MSAVVKVKKETMRELAKIVGKLTMKREKKVTYDEAVRFLLKKEKKTPSVNLRELVRKSFSGASPEDFKEYSYEDV